MQSGRAGGVSRRRRQEGRFAQANACPAAGEGAPFVFALDESVFLRRTAWAGEPLLSMPPAERRHYIPVIVRRRFPGRKLLRKNWNARKKTLPGSAFRTNSALRSSGGDGGRAYAGPEGAGFERRGHERRKSVETGAERRDSDRPRVRRGSPAASRTRSENLAVSGSSAVPVAARRSPLVARRSRCPRLPPGFSEGGVMVRTWKTAVFRLRIVESFASVTGRPKTAQARPVARSCCRL